MILVISFFFTCDYKKTMRIFLTLLLVLLLTSCQKKQYGEVWKEYDWLPQGAEYSNPYAIPRQDRSQAYPYDNDYDYVPPQGWGMCSGSDNLGNCE